MCSLTQFNCNFVQTKKNKGRRGDIRYPPDMETVQNLSTIVYKRQRCKRGQSSSLLLWAESYVLGPKKPQTSPLFFSPLFSSPLPCPALPSLSLITYNCNLATAPRNMELLSRKLLVIFSQQISSFPTEPGSFYVA